MTARNLLVYPTEKLLELQCCFSLWWSFGPMFGQTQLELHTACDILELNQLFKGFKIFLHPSDNFSYIDNFVGYI